MAYKENNGRRPGVIYIAESGRLSELRGWRVLKYGYSGNPRRRQFFLRSKAYAGQSDWVIRCAIRVPEMASAEQLLDRIVRETDSAVSHGMDNEELFSPVLMYRSGESSVHLAHRLLQTYGDNASSRLMLEAIDLVGPFIGSAEADRLSLQIERLASGSERSPKRLTYGALMALKREAHYLQSELEKEEDDYLRSLEFTPPAEETPIWDRRREPPLLLDQYQSEDADVLSEEGCYPDDIGDELEADVAQTSVNNWLSGGR